MSFASPAWFAALAILPLGFLLYALARRRRRRWAIRFPAVATVAAVAPRPSAWRRRIPAALLALAVVALVGALARPQSTVAVPIERATVIMIMDGSRSMQAVDVDPSRIAAAKAAGASFIDRFPDRLRLGFVGYSQTPTITQRPTTEHDAVRSALDSLVADGGTATGEAIDVALNMLTERGQRGRAPAAIVLLSDGKSTDGRDPVEIARRARDMKVPIYTVALGTDEGVVPGGPYGQPLPVPPDPEAMRRIAQVSGGQAYEIDEGDALERVYENLGSRIGTREQKREVSASFALGGLLLLAAAAGLAVRWRSRLP
ncbi:MAG: VWA domain-containing protein [Actinomycetota bacterium]|nr:VWA domain-containing protein [Actinomycetota bacterium]MDQ5808370.1 VWA domain-containing protein [Actinomycetota bacterium]